MEKKKNWQFYDILSGHPHNYSLQSVIEWKEVTQSTPVCTIRNQIKLCAVYWRILEGFFAPLGKSTLSWKLWLLQQDSAPLHGLKFTKFWILRIIPSFISKEDWPARSSNLNSLDGFIWSVLEKRIDFISHQSLESLKVKLRKEWDAISQEMLCVTCLIQWQIDGCGY